MDLSDYSIVNYLNDHSGYQCGYCGSSDANYSHGMWSYQLTCQDYEDLINRGCRRSGKYVYKPTMDKMCCPCYTIRQEALNFKLSKSQKKVLKKVNRYLSTGEKRNMNSKDGKAEEDGDIEGENMEDGPSSSWMHEAADKIDKIGKDVTERKIGVSSSSKVSEDVDSSLSEEGKKKGVDEREVGAKDVATSDEKPAKKLAKTPRPGEGADPGKPPCRKAKIIRKEKKLAKLAQKAASGSEVLKEDLQAGSEAGSKTQTSKSLEDFLQEDHLPGQEPKHKLEVTLIRSSPRSYEFQGTFDESYSVYKKYQVTIHKDPPTRCTSKQFTRFLVDSPLTALYTIGGPKSGFGSFHQHYRLDGKLIAVAVLDVLPHCVSSVYFYYDPDYKFLSLGTYSALREIALTRELNKKCQQIEYYYMGFYIQNCIKMKYKGHFDPSFLLCPEVYSWNPIARCIPKLEVSAYSRLDETDAEDPPPDPEKVLIFYSQQIMPYKVFQLASRTGNYHTRDVTEYASVIGKKCSEKILLLLN